MNAAEARERSFAAITPRDIERRMAVIDELIAGRSETGFFDAKHDVSAIAPILATALCGALEQLGYTAYVRDGCIRIGWGEL